MQASVYRVYATRALEGSRVSGELFFLCFRGKRTICAKMALFPAAHQAGLNLLRSLKRTTAMVATAPLSNGFFLDPAFHAPFID